MNNLTIARKVVIIGCGFVGSTIAYTLMNKGLFGKMILIDNDHDKAEGEAMDISHGLLFAKPMEIAAGTYDDIKDAAMIIITAGANQKPGESRIDLVKKNATIMASIVSEIKKRDYRGIILIVANPVDILTRVAQKLSGLDYGHVFGSGTVLDTARLRYLLGQHLAIDSRSIHAFIIGEHGDSEIPVWSSANVAGVPIHNFCELRGFFNHDDAMKKFGEEVKNSAYEIIQKKKATYYGIGMAVARICEAVIRDEDSILPVSTSLNDEFGLSGVTLSIPAIVGANGVERVVPIDLDEEEQKKLVESADILKKVLTDIGY